MNLVKNEKGITLISLVITVIVLVIIAAVSITAGTDSLDSTRLRGLYTNLEIIQKRVDEVVTNNESFIDSSGNTINIIEAGTAYADLDDTKKTLLQYIIQLENPDLVASNFRYFTAEELDSILDLTEMSNNVFIDFQNRIVIDEKGVKADGRMHYMLEKNPTYFVEQNTTKNTGELESLIYGTPVKCGEGLYKISVSSSNNIGDLSQDSGYVQYKKTTTKYWENSSNKEIILEQLVEYDVKYVDINNNTRQEKIKVEVSSDGSVTVTVL